MTGGPITKKAAAPEEEEVIFNDRKISPQFAVGLPIFYEYNQKNRKVRGQASIIGWHRPDIVITTVPADTRLLLISTGTELIVRYLFEGAVYGFVTHLIAKQQQPLPMWMLEFPELVEVKNLRRSPRISVFISAAGADGESMVMLDLSAQGARLAVTSMLDVGELIRLSFTLPDGNKINDIFASVMRVENNRQERCIGVQFDESDREQVQKIKNYLESIPGYSRS